PPDAERGDAVGLAGVDDLRRPLERPGGLLVRVRVELLDRDVVRPLGALRERQRVRRDHLFERHRALLAAAATGAQRQPEKNAEPKGRGHADILLWSTDGTTPWEIPITILCRVGDRWPSPISSVCYPCPSSTGVGTSSARPGT